MYLAYRFLSLCCNFTKVLLRLLKRYYFLSALRFTMTIDHSVVLTWVIQNPSIPVNCNQERDTDSDLLMNTTNCCSQDKNKNTNTRNRNRHQESNPLANVCSEAEHCQVQRRQYCQLWGRCGGACLGRQIVRVLAWVGKLSRSPKKGYFIFNVTFVRQCFNL